MNPEIKREYCGCMILLEREGGAKTILKSLCKSVSQTKIGLWTGIFEAKVSHTPLIVVDRPPTVMKGKKEFYLYRLFALDLIVDGREWVLLLGPYFTLTREAVDGLREKEKEISYERIFLPALLSIAQHQEPLGEVVGLSWGGRIESDGKKSKTFLISGNDVLRSKSYTAIFEKFADQGLKIKTQRIVLGFNRADRVPQEDLPWRRRELKLAIDFHGNIRVKSPLDETGVKALLSFFQKMRENSLIKATNVCPLHRLDDTDPT